MFFNLFHPPPNHLQVDIHSHLLAGIDDGVKTIDEAVAIIRVFHQLGYKKLITTPHIIHDYYPNTPEIIKEKLALLQVRLKKENLDIEIEAAAEYLIDEHFLALLKCTQEICFFGENYVLIETSFLNRPAMLNEVIFELQTQGYTPVLAHPERYIYIQKNMSELEYLLSLGVKFQINANSLVGYYSAPAQKLAQKMIVAKMVHLIGSDTHHQQHLSFYQKAIRSKYFEKCRQLSLLNNSL